MSVLIFSISFSKKDDKIIKKQQLQEQEVNQSPISSPVIKNATNNIKEDKKKAHVSSVFSMIIDNTSDDGKTPSDNELQMFDPDPAPDETYTFHHTTVRI